MNAADGFENVLKQWLTNAAPLNAPDQLHHDAIERARNTAQRRAIRSRMSNASGQTRIGRISLVFRAATTATLLVAATAVFLVWGGGQPKPSIPPMASPSPTPVATVGPSTSSATATPSPSSSTSRLASWPFGPQFTYVLPAWDVERENPSRASEQVFAFEGHGHGVFIAAPLNPVVHPCPQGVGSSRVPIRRSPSGFLEDMRRIAGVDFTDPVEGTFDGRPALFSQRTERSVTCSSDLHSGSGLGSEILGLRPAARSILLEVNGRIVFIEAWADTDQELADWLPTAMEFVDSIEFRSRP